MSSAPLTEAEAAHARYAGGRRRPGPRRCPDRGDGGGHARAGVALRPHTKTHKSVAFARRQMAAGAGGLTVAKIGEAEVFADAGLTDLFIAYPVIAQGPKAERLRRLAERTTLSVGADSVVGLDALAAAVRAAWRAAAPARPDRGRRRWGADGRSAGARSGALARYAAGAWTAGRRGLHPRGPRLRRTGRALAAADDEVTGLGRGRCGRS